MIHSPGLLLTLLAFACVIGPLVFIHEMGHYWVGRWFGIKAETFSIGFGRELVGWTDRRGTRWKLGWLPLGGYVRFAGDMTAASEPTAEWLSLPADERNRTFQAKPVWQRALVVAAGPAINLLAAVAILGAFAVGVGDSRSLVGTVLPNSAAAAAGVRPGDRIVALDGQEVGQFQELAGYIVSRPGQPLRLAIRRGGERIDLTARIGRTALRLPDGRTVAIGQLGIGRAAVSPLGAPAAGVRETAGILGTMAGTIGQIVTGRRSAEELGGPISIAQVSGQQLAVGWTPLVWLIALVSINLGFINLLPVPMLDGGHLLFYAIEGVRRRPVGLAAQEWAYRGGLAAILALMVFVTANDLGRLGVWEGLSGLIG